MMVSYLPHEGLHVVVMSQRYSNEWTRRVYNVPPHVGLGWKPYRILIQSHGGISAKAFHDIRSFRRWLGGRFRASLVKRGKGIYIGRLVAR